MDAKSMYDVTVPAVRLDPKSAPVFHGASRTLSAVLEVTAPLVFFPHVKVSVEAAGGHVVESDSRHGVVMEGLPRGRYAVDVQLPGSIPPGSVRFRLDVGHRESMVDVTAGGREVSGGVLDPGSSGADAWVWKFAAEAPAKPIGDLPWKKGHGDWFFRHFDHAATTIITYLLKDSPLLRGRILDVGCGDGITDLSIALRTGCRELIGVDPFSGFDRLPEILAANGLPPDLPPKSLRFMREDANHLPFEDDSFDVVLSWGSVEHMAGGYLQALREVKRVLKPDGLFMVAPGLFYSTIGHHLDEFSNEPFFHLKKTREELREFVMATPPKYIDRSGEFASNAQYWQWFTELNPITVTQFEKELRALEFEPWRVALRTDPLVEYTPELQKYSIETLANAELYMSCFNRKKQG
jgi:SAM-dependent methyltransferase